MFDLTDYNKTVGFTIYPTAIFGGNYTKVKLLSILDYQSARSYADVDSLCMAGYPYLPAGTPKDHKSYLYLKVKNQNNEINIIPLPWVNTDSIARHSETTANLKVLLKSPTEADLLRKIITGNGFNILDISIN